MAQVTFLALALTNHGALLGLDLDNVFKSLVLLCVSLIRQIGLHRTTIFEHHSAT